VQSEQPSSWSARLFVFTAPPARFLVAVAGAAAAAASVDDAASLPVLLNKTRGPD